VCVGNYHLFFRVNVTKREASRHLYSVYMPTVFFFLLDGVIPPRYTTDEDHNIDIIIIIIMISYKTTKIYSTRLLHVEFRFFQHPNAAAARTQRTTIRLYRSTCNICYFNQICAVVIIVCVCIKLLKKTYITIKGRARLFV